MDDNFFVRLRDRPTAYLHPDGDGYIVKEGQIGAAVFKKQNGMAVLKYYAPSNLELIDIEETMQPVPEDVPGPDRLSILQDIATKMSVIVLMLISFILIVCHCG